MPLLNPCQLLRAAATRLRALCPVVTLALALARVPTAWSQNTQAEERTERSTKPATSAPELRPPLIAPSDSNRPKVESSFDRMKADKFAGPKSDASRVVRTPPDISDLLPRDQVTPQVRADYEFLFKEAPQLVDAQGRDLKPLQPEQWVGTTPVQRENLKANVSELVKKFAVQVAQLELRSKLSRFSSFGETEHAPSLHPQTARLNERYLESMRGTLARLYAVQRVIEPGLGSRDEDPAKRAERDKILAHLIESDATIRVMLYRPCVPTRVACGGGWNYGQPTAIPPPIDWATVAPADPMRAATVSAVGSISAMTRPRPDLGLASERKPIGTGFLVRSSLVMTNWHVIADGDAPTLLGTGRDGQELKLEQGALPEIDFYNEDCVASPSLSAAINGIVFVHPTLDVALVRIGPLRHRSSPEAPALAAPQLEPKPLTLRRTPRMPLKDQFVAVVGYPLLCEDTAIDRQQCRIIFMDESRRGSRRIAPGTIIQSANQIDSEKNTPAWRHDCTTLHGSSGSPVIDLQSCQVIALHYKSETEDDPAKRIGNFAIPISELAREARLISGDLALDWTD